MNDIQNEASYSAKTSGYSLSTTKRSKNNPIGITGSPKMGIPVKVILNQLLILLSVKVSLKLLRENL